MLKYLPPLCFPPSQGGTIGGFAEVYCILYSAQKAEIDLLEDG